MPIYRITAPNGVTYQTEGPPNATPEQVKAVILAAHPEAAQPAAPQPVAQPAAQPGIEDESYLSTLGRAFRREGFPTIQKGLASIVEDAPEILASIAGMMPGTTPAGSKLAQALGYLVKTSEPYRELTQPTVKATRESAEETIRAAGPRQYKGFFEEEGAARKLASLGETVAGSALPVVAGLGTGLITRSPVAAGAVMAGGTVPMTYGGIRERQQAEGIDDVQRAVIGTAVSSALDVLTGVGGKVLRGSTPAIREALESGLRQAVVRVAQTGVSEAGTETLQTVVEQVAGGTDPLTKKSVLEALEGGLAGALGGAVFGGTVEGAGAISNKLAARSEKPAAAPDVEESPAVQQEYMRLVSEATSARMQAEPKLTQRQAFDQVVKDADKLYQTAITNVVGGAEADVDTELDVSEGAGAGVPAAGAAAPSGAVPGAIAEPAVGGLAQPDLGVPPVEDRPAARVAPLEVEAFAPAVAAVQEAPNNKARKSLALQLVSDVVQAMPELQGLPKNKYNQAANQMVQAAARGEQFDPVAIVQGVAPKIKAAPAAAVAPTPALELPAAPVAPAIDEVAVAPVKAAIEAAAAPAPAAPGVVPSLAQSAARELGITPAVAPPPAPVAAAPAAPAPEVAAPAGLPKVAQSLQSGDVVRTDMGDTFTVSKNTPPSRAGGDNIIIGTWDNGKEQVFKGSELDTGFIPQPYTDANTGERKMGEAWTVERAAPEPTPEPTITPAPAAPEPKGVAPEIIDAELEPVEGKPDFYRNPLPTDVDEWASLHVGKTQKENQALVARRRAAETGATVLDIPISDLVGIEDEVGKRALETPSTELPYVEYANGKYYVVDGNHRVVASYLNGAKSIQARVGNLDEPGVPPIAPAPAPQPTPEAAAAAPPGAPPVPPAPPPTGGPPPGQPGPKKQPKVVSKGKEVKLTQAQTRTALEKATTTRRKLNRIQQRIANTNKTADVVSGQIELGKLVRGDKENWALLRGVFDTLDVGKWRAILPALSTEDIFRVLKGRLPGLTEADRIIRQDMTRYETKEYLALADELEQIGTFLQKHPKAAQALSDLQFVSVAYQVDPSLAANAQEYADKFDKKTRELRAELGNTPVTDAKKQRSLKTKLDNRFREIKSVYEGAVLDDGRVYGWRDLARPEIGANKGKEIFKRIRDAHRKDLEASYQAIRSRLMETKEGEKLDEALEKLEKQFKPAREQTIYFPAMRFGQFYARIGTGANSIFKMFETETKRNQFVQLMRERGEEVTETGNVEDLRNQFEGVSGGPLKEVLDLFEDNPRDIGALRGQVFDLWLQTLSSGDMRKHMAPRKMRAGYSTDILKNFANFRRASINSAKRAQFGYKLRNEISRASDGIAGLPDQAKMQEFIKEIELRVMSDLTPPERGGSMWQQAVEFGNKMAFYQYLANPKTAIIQLTQLHIVAFPMLAQKYGTTKAGAALAKYGFSSLGGFVTSPLKAIKRENGSFTFDWEQPNLLDNPISALKQESDPELYEVLSEGWQEGRDLNLWMDTFANDIGGYGMADPDQRTALQELSAGRPLTATLRGATFAFEAMGTLMHQMERVNREATYMAALELEYREARKAGKSHVEAKKAAIEKAADTTLAATFDFSAYNKPRVLTTSLGRIAGQFFTYPYMMTSLLARNMYTAIKMSGLEPGERSAAIKVATGSLVNISLYAGLTGVPLYGIFKAMGFMLSALFGDDEDEGLRYVDENGNVRFTYNVDWWFRNVWIPEFFGPDGTVASLLGISDETAATLALAAEKGPISAITDIDLSNSVALDFLFFLPQESRAETPEGKFMEYTFNVLAGAFGGTVLDYIKAGRDVATGYSDRALEKLPKLFSNVAKANRFGAEGQLNYAGELSGMDKDFWTSDKQILLSLGFNSTEAAQRQQQNYEGREITKKIEKSRNDVLAKFRKVAIDVEKEGGMTDAIQPDLDDAYDAARKFNEVHPQYMISPDTIYEAQTNAILKMRESRFYEGVPIDERGRTPYLEDILRRRTQPEEVE